MTLMLMRELTFVADISAARAAILTNDARSYLENLAADHVNAKAVNITLGGEHPSDRPGFLSIGICFVALAAEARRRVSIMTSPVEPLEPVLPGHPIPRADQG